MKPGNIPTAIIGPIIERLARERWPHSGYEILAEKVGCDESAIRGAIEQVYEGISFDFADRLFCALGPGVRMWRTPELSDIYYGVKFVETCALPGCGKQFPEKVSGARRKRYCSRRCQDLGRQIGRGATGERLRQKGKCLRGHKMTPGARQCLICRNEARNRKKQNDPEWAERTRKRQRDWARAKRARAKAAA